MSKHAHLTLLERNIIYTGIRNNHKIIEIAVSINKDASTVSKEIKLHRYMSYLCSLKMQCANYKTCKYNRECFSNCPDYVEFKCKRRDRSPGACDGCSNINSCRFTKYKYDPLKAYESYRENLVSSREGVNLTQEEAKAIAEIVVPLIKNGHSPYQIVNDHPEINISEKTLYNYIESNIFKEYGITNLDLRRQVSRKIPKKLSNKYKKRQDRRYLIGRKYSDYLNYMEENPNANVVQMDTVYNDITKGPFVQTFKFLKCGFMIGFYHEKKDSKEMVDGVNLLEEIIGIDLFQKYFQVILTDRGTEFIDANGIEFNKDGIRRCHVFYCDPMASYQKGSLENFHEELRYIIPKDKDLYELGLTSQEALNVALSHVNSSSKEKLEGKSPIELMKFFYPELMEKFEAFGIKEISKDKIVLNPSLLKEFKK